MELNQKTSSEIKLPLKVAMEKCRAKVDVKSAFKNLFLTNSLDGSEDYLVSPKIMQLVGAKVQEFRENLMKEENQHENRHYDDNDNESNIDDNRVFNSDNLAFPETARWALCGMKNLTQPPSRDSLAAQKLLQCNMLPILLQTINVKDFIKIKERTVRTLDTIY